MIKKRILMCAESSHIVSGFGNYTRNVLQRLHDTGKYEIAELSCYRDTSIPKTEPWKVYPVSVKSNHPLYEKYASNDANQFGQWMFEFVVTDFKPNIVFDIRDFWNFTYQETSPLRPFYHWMIAPTYDSAPQKIETINLFHNADTLCFHTEWAKQNLIHRYNYNNNNIKSVVSDAIDHDVFYPVSENKIQHKAKYGLNDNLFIIGSVMRNQKRKLIPDLLETFSRLCKSNTTEKTPVLYLHTSYPDGLAWDLPALLLEYQIADRVLLSYKCTDCNNFFPSFYVGPKTICKYCNTKKALIASVQNGVSEQQLKDIYNLFDIYVQYAICEGFGIPPTEAAACGVPVISIDHEAMGEVGANIGGDLIPVQRLFREQETNALRSYPDNNLLLDKLNKYILMNANEIKYIGQKSRQMCMDNYSWDKTAKTFEEIFDNIDIEQKLSWTCPQRPINHKYTLSKMITIRDTVYEIVDNIIMEPFLKHTNFIEDMIKSANDGYVQHGSKNFPFNIQNIITILQGYMNNKASLETLRLNSSAILSKEIQELLNYSH